MNYLENPTGYFEDLLRLGKLKAAIWQQQAPQYLPQAKALESLIAQKSRETLEQGGFLPLEYLFRVFNLDRFEKHCVMMALLPELDRNFETIYRFLHKDEAMGLLSVDLAMALYNPSPGQKADCRGCLAATAPLMRYFLEDVSQGGASGLSGLLKVRQRILSFVLENNWMNPQLDLCTEIWWPPNQTQEAGQPNPAEPWVRMLDFLQRLSEQKPEGLRQTVFFHLIGPEGVGKKRQVKKFGAAGGQPILFVKGTYLLGHLESLDYLLDQILREILIQQSLICIEGLEKAFESETEEGRLALINGLNQIGALTPVMFAVSQEPWRFYEPDPACLFVPIQMEIPDLLASQDLWQQFALKYPLDWELSGSELANKFNFTPGQMQEALKAAQNSAYWAGQSQISRKFLYQGCYQQIQHNLGQRALRVKTYGSWEDLILPPYSKSILQQACQQVKYKHRVYGQWGFEQKMAYGKGLSLLFSGPPGTGKTMAAQVLAGELDLEIYKVELAAVISKYVGETEKNLQDIFREAQKSQAVLFFDEADALFGKRTEIKDVNDKYSNMEAAFMLQKMEEYSGISILATNYLQNFDDAFKRRIKFIVDFPFPDIKYREMLWQAVFPKQLPLDEDLDVEYLAANFELSGSNIKNIAINAAFLGAAAGQKVGMKEIIAAIKNELAKSGKILSREELGQYYMLL